MQDIVLKKNKEKSLLRRHPWVYDTAVAKAGQKGVKIAAGEMVRVVSHDGRELGFGGWSPASTLRVRMFTYAGEEAPQPGFLTRRIEKAVVARASLLERTNARRLVFAEADGIPGLVADMYGDWVVTQFQSAAVQANSEEIVAEAFPNHHGAHSFQEDILSRKNQIVPLLSRAIINSAG